MGDFKEKYIHCMRKLSTPLILVRYIDAIFMIWFHILEELNGFIKHLNVCTESILFTSEVSKTEINFRDIKIKLEERS